MRAPAMGLRAARADGAPRRSWLRCGNSALLAAPDSCNPTLGGPRGSPFPSAAFGTRTCSNQYLTRSKILNPFRRGPVARPEPSRSPCALGLERMDMVMVRPKRRRGPLLAAAGRAFLGARIIGSVHVAQSEAPLSKPETNAVSARRIPKI